MRRQESALASNYQDKMYLKYKEKASFAHKIPTNWFSEPDTEPKIATKPGSSELLRRYSQPCHTLTVVLILQFALPDLKVFHTYAEAPAKIKSSDLYI